ncbi:hypothetical protein ACLOJK_032729, partial [Asimina triloba]
KLPHQPCAGDCYQLQDAKIPSSRGQDPIFNPAQSSSYHNISCNSVDCHQVGLPTSCPSYYSTCVYEATYGDNSTSRGFLAYNRLMLTASDVLPHFQFGRGQQNRGLFAKRLSCLGLAAERFP